MQRTVLLVDDDADLLAGLRRALRTEPYRLLTADSAATALVELAHQSIDVVLSDEGMPGMRGTEFLARVQREYPDVVRMILTGQRNLDVAMRAINEGQVYRFFMKPCNSVELAHAIRQGIQQRALLVESRRLLHYARRQAALIDELDPAMEGLSQVRRDDSGAIVLDDVATDLDALLKEIQAELTTTEARLHEQEIRSRVTHLRPGRTKRSGGREPDRRD